LPNLVHQRLRGFAAPDLGADVKALQGRNGYRLRIGSYRVIFDEDAITILAVYIGRRASTTYKRS
jgi:mRNA interferase RelE/StbE